MSHLPSQRNVRWPANSPWRDTDSAAMQRHVANSNADLFVIIAVCAIGLLATIDVMLRFPDLGALIASYNQF